MTDFEKSIKRNVDEPLFEKIRDHKYGDGGNTYSDVYTYGDVASWITWNRDAQGNLSGKKEPWKNTYIQNDGELDWNKDSNLSLEQQFSRRLTTDVVFVGLNMSGDGAPAKSKSSPPFSNARGHGTIIETFKDTAAEGGYFTDIIKPDARLLKSIGNPANSAEVMEILKRRDKLSDDILKDQICLFKKELDFIGAKKPLLIVFGGDAAWILEQGFNQKFNYSSHVLDCSRFTAVYIWHYAYVRALEDHRKEASRWLAPYITIPVEAKRPGKVITVPLRTKEKQKSVKNNHSTQMGKAVIQPMAETESVKGGSMTNKNPGEQKLYEIKAFFENNGYPMCKPNWKGNGGYVGSSARSGFQFVIGIVIPDLKYGFSWQARRKDLQLTFDKKIQEIQEKYPELGAYLRRARGNPCFINIPIEQNQTKSLEAALKDTLEVIKKTRSIIGY